MEQESKVERLQKTLSIFFQEPNILEEALTHSSAFTKGVSNERMEFLGDSVLGLVITEYLYLTFPHLDEGKLTKIKSVVVSRQTLAILAKELSLVDFCIFGQGMPKKNELPTSILANIFEAVLGAIYLDQGYGIAKEFVLPLVQKRIQNRSDGYHWEDYKSLLQQFSQKKYGKTPTYQLISAEGPDHKKTFRIVSEIGGKKFAEGLGKRKKDAEQMSAKKTLEILKKSSLTKSDFKKNLSKKSKHSLLKQVQNWWQKKKHTT